MQITALLIAEKDGVSFYGLESLRLTQKSKISLEDGGIKCSCTAFKVVKNCIHTRLLENLLKEKMWESVLYVPGSMSSGIPLNEGQVGCVIYRDKSSYVYLLPPVDSIIHAYQVVEAIRKDAFDDGYITSTGSHERLYVEIREAFAKGLSLTNTEITGIPASEGKIIKEVTKESSSPKKEVKKEVIPEPVVEAPAWSKIKPPEDFYVSKDVWESLLWCGSNGDNVLLLGPTGTGKTELMYRINKALGLTIEPFNFGAMQEPRISLIGNTHFSKEKGTYFKQSRFVRAIQKRDGIVALDEVTRADYSALNIIFSLMDGQRYLALDEDEDAPVIYRGQFIAFFATANVGFEYTGTEALDRALKDRFALKVTLDYPPASPELDIVCKRYPKVNKKLMMKVVDTASDQRAMAKEGEFDETISTRMVLDCAKCLSTGLDARTAVKFTILGCFSSEGGAESPRYKLVQLFQKRASELV